MAGNKLFGITYNTASEIEAEHFKRYQDEMRAAAQAGNQAAANSARMRQIAINLVGTPESRKARRTEKLLTEVQEQNPRAEGESELQHQIRVREAALGEMAKIDPVQAINMANSIVQLRDSQIAREGKLIGNDKARADAEMHSTIVLRDATGRSLDGASFKGENVSDALRQAQEYKQEKLREALENKDEEGARVWGKASPTTLANALEYNPSGSSRAGKLSGADQRFIKPIEDAAASNQAMIRMSDELGNALWALNPVTGEVGKFANTLRNTTLGMEQINDSKLKANWQEYQAWGVQNADKAQFRIDDEEGFVAWMKNKFTDRFSEWTGEGGKYHEAFQKALGGLTSNAADHGQVSEYLQAQVKMMAYTLAKTLDPGGRLSDQDVDMAMEMIIGNGDPEVISQRLEERLADTYEHLTPRLNAARRGEYGTTGEDFVNLYDSTYKRARDSVDKLREETLKHRAARDKAVFQMSLDEIGDSIEVD